MVKEFIAWIKQGNLIAIAVGLLIAFEAGKLITSLTENLISPIIGSFGGADFSSKTFTVNDTEFFYGKFINSVIAFLIVALICFLLVKAAVKMFGKDADAPDPAVEALGEIKGLLAEQNSTLSRIASK